MSREVLFSFIITSLAGLSTVLGTLFILIKKKKEVIIPATLSLTIGVMLATSVIDLIPSSLQSLQLKFTLIPSILLSLIFLSLGVVISLTIDKLLPTTNDNQLYRVGIISMLAIILHNIPEGMATFMVSNADIKLGISLAVAIALHNIPEGISISIPIYHSTKCKRKAFLFTFISGMSELLGAIITYLFLGSYINNTIIGLLFGLIAGIMIHISLYELLPTVKKYKNNKLSIIYFIIGVLIVYINHNFF
ncbi:MAG: ZIP family metal transporter [Bacilli bacterium]|nr:ZIP family metal transporter [Bacilli bacterium]MDD4608192.1 ZIP family metal transporter [Bacilli bacterium]